LLDSYCDERLAAAQENLAVTDQTMRFMAPPPEFRAARDAILLASTSDPTARAAVNSGRLATPMVYVGGLFPKHRPGDPELVGAVLVDVVTADGSRLRRHLADAGGGWLALTAGERSPEVGHRMVGIADQSSAVRETYAPDGRPRTWLIRPDGYVAACTEPSAEAIQAAWVGGTGAIAP